MKVGLIFIPSATAWAGLVSILPKIPSVGTTVGRYHSNFRLIDCRGPQLPPGRSHSLQGLDHTLKSSLTGGRVSLAATTTLAFCG